MVAKTRAKTPFGCDHGAPRATRVNEFEQRLPPRRRRGGDVPSRGGVVRRQRRRARVRATRGIARRHARRDAATPRRVADETRVRSSWAAERSDVGSRPFAVNRLLLQELRRLLPPRRSRARAATRNASPSRDRGASRRGARAAAAARSAATTAPPGAPARKIRLRRARLVPRAPNPTRRRGASDRRRALSRATPPRRPGDRASAR